MELSGMSMISSRASKPPVSAVTARRAAASDAYALFIHSAPSCANTCSPGKSGNFPGVPESLLSADILSDTPRACATATEVATTERPVRSRACDEGLYENVKTENDPEGRTDRGVRPWGLDPADSGST